MPLSSGGLTSQQGEGDQVSWQAHLYLVEALQSLSCCPWAGFRDGSADAGLEIVAMDWMVDAMFRQASLGRQLLYGEPYERESGCGSSVARVLPCVDNSSWVPQIPSGRPVY